MTIRVESLSVRKKVRIARDNERFAQRCSPGVRIGDSSVHRSVRVLSNQKKASPDNDAQKKAERERERETSAAE